MYAVCGRGDEVSVDEDSAALVARDADVSQPGELSEVGIVPADDALSEAPGARDAALWNEKGRIAETADEMSKAISVTEI